MFRELALGVVLEQVPAVEKDGGKPEKGTPEGVWDRVRLKRFLSIQERPGLSLKGP